MNQCHPPTTGAPAAFTKRCPASAPRASGGTGWLNVNTMGWPTPTVMPSVGNTLALTRLVGASVRNAVVVWASRCVAPVTVAVTRYTVSYASTPSDFQRPVAGSQWPLT